MFEGKAWAPTPDLDKQDTELEWKIFWHMLFSQFRSFSVPESSDSTSNNLQEVTSRLLTDRLLAHLKCSFSKPRYSSIIATHIASYNGNCRV